MLRGVSLWSRVTLLAVAAQNSNPGESDPESQSIRQPACPCLPGHPDPLPFSKPPTVTMSQHHLDVGPREQRLTAHVERSLPGAGVSLSPTPDHTLHLIAPPRGGHYKPPCLQMGKPRCSGQIRAQGHPVWPWQRPERICRLARRLLGHGWLSASHPRWPPPQRQDPGADISEAEMMNVTLAGDKGVICCLGAPCPAGCRVQVTRVHPGRKALHPLL